LEKRIPMAAGLGGGSSDAAATLEGLNELFGQALGPADLHQLAAALGSDVPFFLQPCPALATGRGERVVSLEPFPALTEAALVLVYPGFGIPTAWTYQQLSRFPQIAAGRAGRAQQLIQALHTGSLADAAPHFYNALEAPALEKYPLLPMIREFLRAQGAAVSLMSGSGSTVFGVFANVETANRAKRAVVERFEGAWCEAVPV
jgi:4-diphosphocytidyl-2-C-methyl-D-erythritol kinase